MGNVSSCCEARRERTAEREVRALRQHSTDDEPTSGAADREWVSHVGDCERGDELQG